MLRRILALTAVAIAFPALVAAQDSTGSTPRAEKRRIYRDPQVIRQEEIEYEIDARNALDLVQRLRPFWIRVNRGPTSINLGTAGPVVYVNNVKQGSVSVLVQYATANIREIRHLTGTEASMRYGTAHENGALLLSLR
jgi:hypothetical protein